MEIILIELGQVIKKGRMDYDFYTPNQPKMTDSIVKGFTQDKLENICLYIGTGKTAARNSYPDKGIRIIKVKNVTGSGINWEHHFYVTDEFYDDFKHKAKVQLGDILILCSAHNKSYIGRCDIIDSFPNEVIENDSKCCCVGELIIVRANPEKIISEYLITFLRLPIVQEQIKRMVKGQSAHLYSKDLKRLDIILPSKPLQEEIAEINRVSQIDYTSRIKEAKLALNKARGQMSHLIMKGKN